MKAKNIGSNRTLVVQAILTALVLVSQVQANVGGGGIPITPYPRGSQVTLQQVTTNSKKLSGRCGTILSRKPASTKASTD